MPEGKRPLEMELGALKNAVEDKFDQLRVRAFGDRAELGIRELRPAPNHLNIYGRIVFKNRKGCPHYYRLLYDSRMKHDCWGNAKLTNENEVYLHDENYMYHDAMYDEIISRSLK